MPGRFGHWHGSYPVIVCMGIITCSYSDPEGEPMFEMQTGVPGTRYLNGLFWLTGLAAAAWLLAGWVAGGESTKLALAGLVLVGGAAAVESCSDHPREEK